MWTSDGLGLAGKCGNSVVAALAIISFLSCRAFTKLFPGLNEA